MGGLASSPEILPPDSNTGVGPSLHFFLPTPTLPSCQWKTQPPTLSRHQGLISTNELGMETKCLMQTNTTGLGDLAGCPPFLCSKPQ